MLFAAAPFIPGLATASPLPACRRLWSGAQELISPRDGGEGLGWLLPPSTHPDPDAHQLPSTSPQSCTGLFSPALWRKPFCATIPPFGTLWSSQHPVEYLGVPLAPSISTCGSRHKVNLVACQAWCPQNAAIPQQDPIHGVVEGELLLGQPRMTPPVSLPPTW